MSRLVVGSVACGLVAFALFATSAGPCRAQSTAPAAAAGTVADITAILDQQKPTPGSAAKMRAAADEPPLAGAAPAELARFYYKRSEARSTLGRHADALADAESALAAAAKGHLGAPEISLMRQMQGTQYLFLGDPKKAMEAFLLRAREATQAGNNGPLFNTYRSIGSILIHTGDLGQAETYLRKSQALLAQVRTSNIFPLYGSNWRAEVAEAAGELAEARGQFAAAEAAYREGELAKRETLGVMAKWPVAPPRSQMEFNIDGMIAAQGRVKARQGRLAEAEADVRQALLNRLTAAGKYTSGTAQETSALADVLVAQGRYPEADKLTRTVLDIYRTIGIADDTKPIVSTLSRLANILNLEGKVREATRVFADIDAATRSWEPKRRDLFSVNVPHIFTLYKTGHVADGITAAQALVTRNTGQFGADSYSTAYARGTLAIGLVAAGRDAEALREFKFAVPILLSNAPDDDDATGVVLRQRQIQTIIERYMALLVRPQVDPGADVAVETFRLAEAIRSRSVQQALAASGARVLAADPAIADLVRREQDSEKQLGAQLGLLDNLLALPPQERDDGALNDLRKQIGTLRADATKARQEVRRRFPKYADLIDPKPPAVGEIKAMLKPDEALVSFYFGSQSSFLWAVPKDGPVAFAGIAASADDIGAKIKSLRAALEPGVATIGQIPPFDLALAHQLYDLLLAPVQAGWMPAKSLVVVTNGALGTLPLGLLTTGPSPSGASEPLFAAYREAPWLARTHAVTMIPSTASLVALRRLPPGSPRRDKLIGFGDPYFNAQQADEAEHPAPAPQLASAAAAVTRAVPFRTRAAAHATDIDKTEFALLPRLPDTRLELTAMARALDVDPSKALFLGRDANERNVETTDLSHFRIVAFATHGLLPGDLDGLTQPALALTAPQVAGVEGDGLLTLEKILPLKLDADWVVLSACNTAAGAGAGAEAVSGLGRAFFYAGTRALLVTNWSVHSASARELITDLFRRQGADPALGRAEALRQAMMSMLDGPGFVDGAGQTVFTYAHPLFWAPYSIIGDGGGT
jgi:CHAT domain-containing protein/tetratricopeptide (TPR) repeat protein